MSNLATRVLVAVIAIPIALGIVWLGGAAVAVLVMVVAVLGTRELFDLAEKTGVRPLRGLGMTLAALAPFITWLLAGEPRFSVGFPPLWGFVQWPLLGALIPVLVLALVLFRRSPADRPISAAAVTLLGPLYCGLLPSSLLVIRYAAGPERSWAAVWLVFFPLAVTWLCDSFAMWGGKLMRGPKLAPTVSPGKTRSGAASGVAGGVLTAVLYVPLALEPVGKGFPLATAALMGFILAVVAQVGDLAESLFKREAGVKDSSGLIPGHGGVLDRLDSLYFALPVAAFLFRAFGVL
ncbi:MAG TPA: CDP-archaeol synthase [Gemmatimonadales bacterium]